MTGVERMTVADVGADVGADVDVAPVRRPERTSRRTTARALFGFAALVLVTHLVVKWVMVDTGVHRHDAAPLHAMFDPELHRSLFWALLLGGCAIWCAERVSASLSWRRLLLASAASASAWAIALALVRGGHRITVVFTRPGEYPQVVDRIESFNAFLSSFVDDIASFPIHVQSHPPGFPLLSWALQRIGLGGSFVLSMLCIVAGGVAVAAVLVVVRDVAGEVMARRAAPFVVFAPAAVSVATSADAFFAGIGAVAAMLVVLATRRRDAAGDALALLGGVVFGVAVFFSYGLVLLATVPLAVARMRHRVRPIVLTTLGAALVVEAIWQSGFFWFEGLLATREQYFEGIGGSRPYPLYVFANVAIFAIILGPALAVALVRLRDKRLWVVVGGALAAVALADLSGISKAEVERIWLPFTPFVLAAGAALSSSVIERGGGTVVRARRLRHFTPVQGWIALQVGYTVLLEVVIRTGW